MGTDAETDFVHFVRHCNRSCLCHLGVLREHKNHTTVQAIFGLEDVLCRCLPTSKRQTKILTMLCWENVTKVTDLPQDVVESFLLTDSDLDNLCDTALSEIAGPPEKVAILGK